MRLNNKRKEKSEGIYCYPARSFLMMSVARLRSRSHRNCYNTSNIFRNTPRPGSVGERGSLQNPQAPLLRQKLPLGVGGGSSRINAPGILCTVVCVVAVVV